MQRFSIDLTRPRSWRDDASNLEEWKRWDRAMRRKQGWRAGLALWHKTNVPGTRSLLSRHWPHRLCWSWSVWVGKHRAGFDGPHRFAFIVARKYRFVELWVWTHYARISWQDYDHMAGLQCHDAPKIYWRHHLQHAEPAGTA